MSDSVEALLRDLLGWLAAGERPYDDVMDAWRTSCPRLPVWEEANDRGLVVHKHMESGIMVGVTDAGRQFLTQHAV